MRAEAFEHDASRQPLCSYCTRRIIFHWSSFQLGDGTPVEGSDRLDSVRGEVGHLAFVAGYADIRGQERVERGDLVDVAVGDVKDARHAPMVRRVTERCQRSDTALLACNPGRCPRSSACMSSQIRVAVYVEIGYNVGIMGDSGPQESSQLPGQAQPPSDRERLPERQPHVPFP